uniref:Uncharacterized protein n=1 Tax=Trichuris muris TaxID=70415 RepID=A0A5S6QDK5_TRIMR
MQYTVPCAMAKRRRLRMDAAIGAEDRLQRTMRFRVCMLAAQKETVLQRSPRFIQLSQYLPSEQAAFELSMPFDSRSDYVQSPIQLSSHPWSFQPFLPRKRCSLLTDVKSDTLHFSMVTPFPTETETEQNICGR